MAQKCVHKGCGKTFTDPDEPCVYHPGPPEFHEGQKGWKCCKPRVLTFDEFLEIPPCTTGKHSTVDDAPLPEPKNAIDESLLKTATPSNASANLPRRVPIAQNVAAMAAAGAVKPASPAPPESDSDDPAQPTPAGASCKRRGCNAVYSASASRDGEECVYHPGQALFHEGSKGWTCCKRRVLEFDEFMKIAGCKKRSRHCFVGKREAERKKAGLLEKLETVRHDFYQTSSTIHASLFLKKIDKDKSRVEFPPSESEIVLDLKTSDGKAYESVMQLYGKIDPAKSAFKILGTKLELTLAKADGLGWPVLRADEKHTGEIIQTGGAGMA